MADYVIALDQGTTSTTCLVVEVTQGALSVRGRATIELEQSFPQPAWVEHSLDDIWSTCARAIIAALQHAAIVPNQIHAIGIANQRETTALWDTHGDPVHPAIVWQDRRTKEHCDRLKEAGHEALFRSRTGLLLDPYFSGTKLAWLLDSVPGARTRAERGELRFGTIDSWLVWKLTGGKSHATDVTNAARTLLFDIHRCQWDSTLADVLGGVPTSLLPQVLACNDIFGRTYGLGFLPDGIPIVGVAGDQQAALFGQACFLPGMSKCTYGTGAFALVNTGPHAMSSSHGLVTTIAWKLGSETIYAIEGSVFIAGAAVQWLRDGLQFFSNSSDIESLAATVPDSGGVMVVPALSGLGAPHWRADARGLISGITRGTTRAHIARATLEGVALQVRDLLSAMRSDSRQPITLLRVDGGASANALLMQFQADVLGVEIHRPQVIDTTAFGAAAMAAYGCGLFSSLDAVARAWQLERRFSPSMSEAMVNEHVERWRTAVSKA